jgi:riboflavin kinase / FMN adenylyltransferase
MNAGRATGGAGTAAVAVGVFDGLHLGHVELLERALALARERRSRTVVVTFDPHPDVVLAPSFEAKPPLTPIPEKRARLLAMGIDHVEVLPFTRELAALEPETFVDRHLIAPFRPHALVVGADFALGRGRTGNVARLERIGATHDFGVYAVPLLERDGAPVTSTRIRGLLDHGRVAAARELLGRAYDLTGRVVQGDAVGRTLGFPTANLRLHEEKLVPGHGVYAVRVGIGDGLARLPGAMSIGVRPTFGGQVRTLEVHVIDWSGDLVGRDLTVEFVEWLRPELRFEDAAALVRAIEEDVARARGILGSEAQAG